MVIKKGKITLEHFSTSSYIKLTIEDKEPIENGRDYEITIKEVWLDYTQYDDLKELMNNKQFNI